MTLQNISESQEAEWRFREIKDWIYFEKRFIEKWDNIWSWDLAQRWMWKES